MRSALMSHELRFDGSWEGWRSAARDALLAELPPTVIVWRTMSNDQDSLFSTVASAPVASAVTVTPKVPKAFMALASDVARYRDDARWNILYRVLWRLTHGEPHLLSIYVDDDVHRLELMSKAVRREGHKMRAFVRFRLVGEGSNEERYVAWFEPEHDVVTREAPFFARRFPAMRWSILTPDVSAHWDRASLSYAPGVSRRDAPSGDELEELWRTYYASIFNPARIKPRMMRAEMPVRYWKHLPEASLIAPLLRDATARVRQMVDREQDVPRHAEPAARAALDTEPAVVSSDMADAQERSAHARARSAARGFSAGSSPLGDRDVRIGTASWTDPTMTARGVFYPDDARSAAGRLAYYASRFSLVEVDATYYSLPSERNSTLWAERTPDGFCFDIKAHALMTGHSTETARLPDDIRGALPARTAGARMVRARDITSELVDDIWRRFLSALEPLRVAGKLGALLLQMPRDFVPSRESERVLATMRARAGGGALLAVEFRHASWVADAAQRERTLAVLREHDMSYVMVDAPPGFATSMPPIIAVTSERLAMVRLHGRRTETWETPVSVTSERYRYLYGAHELSEWVPNIIDVAYRTQGVHVVMNNCHANYGTSNADEITEMLVEADELRRQMYRESVEQRLV
ncbi:MAG: TIGR03915 family putative DNA repair protein [Gemmatimonadaceae bacterium]